MSDYAYRTVNGSFMDWAESVDSGIAALGDGGLRARLERLLDGSVYEEGVAALASLELPALRELRLIMSFVGPDAIDALVALASLPTLEVLDLDGHDLGPAETSRIAEAATGTVLGL